MIDLSLTTRFRALLLIATSYPRSVVLLGVVLIAAAASALPTLVTDTRPNAYLAADNPALLYREKVEERFGLSDPLVIAITSSGEQGIFTPETLSLLQWLTDEVSGLENVDADRVTSLATENNITSTEAGMDVSPFFDAPPRTMEEAVAVRAEVHQFPLYLGNLVARDGKVTLVVVELQDEMLAETAYGELLEAVSRAPVPAGVEVHVAGEGAIAGYLGSYIESDASWLNPLAWLIITVTLFFAYRRLAPALTTNVVIGATVAITLGTMAASGTPFFTITSALPVILIGISVADSIHVYSHFFDQQARFPSKDHEQLVIEVMLDRWRPLSLTTLTTMAGFLGLYFAAEMPPLQYFGLYAAFGVAVAWAYSLIFLPAAMVLTRKHLQRKSASDSSKGNRKFPIHFFKANRLLWATGNFTWNHAGSIIAIAALIAASGLYAASHLVVHDDPIDIFHSSEPIHKADTIINRHMAGTNALDVVIETPQPEDLFEPEYLRRIEALQAYAETLPHVGGTTSIVDYLKQMHRSLNGGGNDQYVIPESKDLVAQLFLSYTATSDPTDFQEKIDYDYQTANVRVHMDSGGFQAGKAVVEALEQYIVEEFETPRIKATLSGRVNLNYHWIKNLGDSHFGALALAVLLVWVVSSLLFRSVVAGLFTLLPVMGSVLLVYSAMVLTGITLGVGTSMFAALAVGLGVDFAIHTLDRLRTLHSLHSGALAAVFDVFYTTTGRALLFNFLAIACGFGVLVSSKIAPLNQFGAIVVLAVGVSFITSMTLLPALVKVLRPAFIDSSTKAGASTAYSFARVSILLVLVGAVSVSLWPSSAEAGESPTADAIVAQMRAVDDGEFVTRKMRMQMTNRNGKTRERHAISYRKYYGEELRTVLFYLSPANIRDTAYLVRDYPEANRDDDQWLYLPAMKKVRRIPAANRGDYFLGSDFTYEDIKMNGRQFLSDYNVSLLGKVDLGGLNTYHLEAIPKSSEASNELGYSRIELWVDESNWIMVEAEFWDLKGRHLKTLRIADVRKIHGIWTRHQLTMSNHKTGHTSRFIFSDVDYEAEVDDGWFSKRALLRGH